MQRSTAVWTLSRTLSIHLTCGGNPHVVSDVVGRDHADLDPAFRTAARRLPYSSRPIRGTRLIAVTRPSNRGRALLYPPQWSGRPPERVRRQSQRCFRPGGGFTHSRIETCEWDRI